MSNCDAASAGTCGAMGVGAVKECAPVDNPQSTKTRRFRPNSHGMANGTLCRPLFEPQKATLYAMAALRNGGRSVRGGNHDDESDRRLCL